MFPEYEQAANLVPSAEDVTADQKVLLGAMVGELPTLRHQPGGIPATHLRAPAKSQDLRNQIPHSGGLAQSQTR